MARLVLTNNQQIHKLILEKNIKAGLDDYSVYDTADFYLAVHKKRKIKTPNFLKYANGDFICSVGTCIYKGSFGLKSLERIYNDHKGDIEELRSNLLGNYLIAIKKNGLIYVFVDKYQILKTYFFNINGDWVIANSLADVASVISDLVVNEFRLLENVFAFANVEKETIFQDIFQLYGDEFLIIDSKSGKLRHVVLSYSRERRKNDNKCIDDLVNEYSKIVKDRFSTVVNVFGSNIALHMTGGLDSRTVFSGFMSACCKPRILYGIGDNPITGTKRADLIANKVYSVEFGLDSYVMDWKTNLLDDIKNWDNSFVNYGFNYKLYGGNTNLFDEYQRKIPNYPSFFESGYFGENLRLREWAANRKTDEFSINTFVRDYHLAYLFRRSTKLYSNRDILAKYVEKQFLIYAKMYGIPSNKGVFSNNHMDELRWITARKADSYWVNFCNEFTNSISMFSLFDLHEFPFDVPFNYRKNAKFQLLLINKLCPKVLQVPLFSHNRQYCYNYQKNSIEPKYPCNIPKVLGSGVEKILRNVGLFKYIKKILYLSNNDYKNEKITASNYIKSLLLNFVNNNQQLKERNFLAIETWADDEIHKFVSYIQWLYGINLVADPYFIKN